MKRRPDLAIVAGVVVWPTVLTRKEWDVLREAAESARLGRRAFSPSAKVRAKAARLLVRKGLCRGTTRYGFFAVAITDKGRRVLGLPPAARPKLRVLRGGRS